MSHYALTIHQAQQKLRSREVSAVELAQSVLTRIQETDERLHSYLTVCAEESLAQAEAADRTLANGATPSTVWYSGCAQGRHPRPGHSLNRGFKNSRTFYCAV